MELPKKVQIIVEQQASKTPIQAQKTQLQILEIVVVEETHPAMTFNLERQVQVLAIHQVVLILLLKTIIQVHLLKTIPQAKIKILLLMEQKRNHLMEMRIQ